MEKHGENERLVERYVVRESFLYLAPASKSDLVLDLVLC